jgi:hypothetical protein
MGISNFKNGYQPRSNIVRDEKGDLVRDCHSILVRWRNHFSQLFNVHGINPLNVELNPICHLLALLGAHHILHISRIRINNVRQTDIHTVEQQVPEPSAFEFEMVIEKLKSYKSPGIDQIPAELIKAGVRTTRSEVHKFITSI